MLGYLCSYKYTATVWAQIAVFKYIILILNHISQYKADTRKYWREREVAAYFKITGSASM